MEAGNSDDECACYAGEERKRVSHFCAAEPAPPERICLDVSTGSGDYDSVSVVLMRRYPADGEEGACLKHAQVQRGGRGVSETRAGAAWRTGRVSCAAGGK
jgi:hypothetical protein